MADEEELLKEDAEAGADEEGAAAEAGAAKKGGGFLFTILKFAAIGLGALIFIVTVVIVTFNIMNGSGQKQAVVPQTESYNAVKPIYIPYDGVGTITTQTADAIPHNLSVNIILEYDQGDNATQTELIGRKNQMIDFIRRFFRSKTADELTPENENMLKNDIKEQLNTNVLDKARVRGVLFTQFDVYETQ